MRQIVPRIGSIVSIAMLIGSIAFVTSSTFASTPILAVQTVGSSVFCGQQQVAQDDMRQGEILTLPAIAPSRFADCTLNIVYRYVDNPQVPAVHRGIEAFDAQWRAAGTFFMSTGRGNSVILTAGQLGQGIQITRPFDGAEVYQLSINLARLEPGFRPALIEWFAVAAVGGEEYTYRSALVQVTMAAVFAPLPGAADPLAGAQTEIPLRSIPSVVGMTLAVAQPRIANFAGPNSFRVAVADRITLDPAQVGIVAAQEPPGGSTIPVGSTVTLSVNRFDPDRAIVPNVINRPAAEARANIGRSNLVAVEVVFVPCEGTLRSDTLNACRAQVGMVGNQLPEPGAIVPVGTTVRIDVGAWPGPRHVPDMTAGNQVGAWWPDAGHAVRQAGFVPTISPVSRLNCRAWGSVYNQHPAGGTLADYGSMVELTLCGDCLSWDDPGFHTGLFEFETCRQDLAGRYLPLGRIFDSIAPGEFPHPRDGSPFN